MAKYQAKTTKTENSVDDFILSIDCDRQPDCQSIVQLMQEQSGYPPKMWGPAIIGFGSYHYKYASGHEGDAPIVGFSPRKAAISLYLGTFEGREELLSQLGKHKTGKGCIYVNKLADIDTVILRKMVAAVVEQYKKP
ncbi:protein of unknown function (DU1801) [Chitinophaga sp. CF118]|uniref:DUF1801 domain-containing protein n=1 Tax=Chitinophaga sp. CF118 TaxID=1884367 RepID=UPI0008EDB582|nr:DUF1801 domain-containing protein [Chitinophaga sp. CF118]SFD97741.1 protein of unknown function (DU1801) [Chitinophaga sp. CF118]